MTAADCLFCKIVSGDVPADVVHETATTLAFHDVNPQAPVHVLVIAKDHHRDVAALAAADPSAAVALIDAAAAVAGQEGLDQGYRLVFNTGRGGNQLVLHVHAHVLGGRQMTWPPG